MKIIKLLLLFICCNAFAQQFTVSSKLSGAKADALHLLRLSPEFRLYSDSNPSGIRIYDSKNREVPYAITTNTNAGIIIANGFTNYPILSKNKVADTSSSVIIENISANKLKEITLAIANTDATKTYSISGSNDLKEWFGLVNNQTLDNLYSSQDIMVYKTVSLPLTTYRYLKVDFDDKKTLPVNIIAAGVLKSGQVPQPIFETLSPVIKIVEVPSEKKTRITVSFDQPIAVNQIAFAIKEPVYFKRNAHILIPELVKRKRKTSTVLNEYTTFELNSSGSNSFGNLDLLEKEFIIEIENNDNQPLVISSVKIYQSPVELLAYLKKGENYTIKAGNNELGAASYDIQDLNELPKDIPQVTILPVHKLTATKNSESSSSNTWIMWLCIITGALIVLYFCLSMVKDMKNKENPQI